MPKMYLLFPFFYIYLCMRAYNQILFVVTTFGVYGSNFILSLWVGALHVRRRDASRIILNTSLQAQLQVKHNKLGPHYFKSIFFNRFCEHINNLIYNGYKPQFKLFPSHLLPYEVYINLYMFRSRMIHRIVNKNCYSKIVILNNCTLW